MIGISQLSHASEKAKKQRVIPLSYIVKVADGADVSRVANEAALRSQGFLQYKYHVAFRGFSIRLPSEQALEHILDMDGVLWAEPDLVVSINKLSIQAPGGRRGRPTPQPPQVVPTGINRIEADLNPFANIDGIDERVNIDVAVLDTGIYLKHPDLNNMGGVTFVSGKRSPNDKNGHGTHVAGIIGALDNQIGVVGGAPGARLHAVKVLGDNGNGSISGVIAGIDWITANADIIDVANMSLAAIGISHSFHEAVKNSVRKGVVYVVAAANSSTDVYGNDMIFGTNDDYIPAAYPEVITVSALQDTDGQAGAFGGSGDDILATFSNYSTNVILNNPVFSSGKAIDGAAPGVWIYSTWKDSSYATASGTSMSSPHYAAVVALYIAKHGRDVNSDGLINEDDVYLIRQALIDLSSPQIDWGNANTLDPDLNLEGLIQADQL